jgi:hypothetical protein
MTADKKRLMTLLCEAHNISCDAKLFDDATYAQQLGKEAEHLLANGVTFQTWIPVSERLPERGQEVIVVSYRTIKPVVFTTNFWDTEHDNWYGITNSMPLPNPPKEVDK